MATRPPAVPASLTLDASLAQAGLARGAAAARMARLEVRCVRDLLFHLPRRYEDLTRMLTLMELRDSPIDGPVSARVSVVDLEVQAGFRRRVQRTVARVRDATGEAEAVWFGRRFVERRLHPGDEIALSGKVEQRGWLPRFQNPEFGPVDEDALHAGRIVPVYRLTEGVTARWLRRTIRRALDEWADAYPEYLPAELPEVEDGAPPLLPLAEALTAVHFPESTEQLHAALRRLRMDELLALQLGMVSRDRQRHRRSGRRIEVTEGRYRETVAGIESSLTAALHARGAAPDVRAELTSDQAAAAQRIREDLSQERPMLRLLQGDVGSGKTAVAALALAWVADAGRQGALLAPTDLLARQHAATLRTLLEPLGHGVTLLTASLPAGERRRALASLAAPPAGTSTGMSEGLVVVGTHALVEERVAFADLGLAVVDEQHRFGVAQREALSAKGEMPHVLLMTATPIPRSLGQILHGDLDVSDLRSPPAGREPVGTGLRGSDELVGLPGRPERGTYRLIVSEVAAGHRAFVVVPLVEDDEESGIRSVGDVAAQLREVLPRVAVPSLDHVPRIEVGIVHGQMRPAERDATMDRFRAGEIHVIVGTTVLEVGVDVPEATVMVILDADRFGLAQLHQLRGRVGRGEAKGWCILVSDTTDETALARLRALTKRDRHGRYLDGFELAEMDLEQRREGELLGLTQSGLPPFRVASLGSAADRALSIRLRNVAEQLVDEQGRLRSGMELLAEELDHGWLARVGAGEVIGEAAAAERSAAPASDA